MMIDLKISQLPLKSKDNSLRSACTWLLPREALISLRTYGDLSCLIIRSEKPEVRYTINTYLIQVIMRATIRKNIKMCGKNISE